MSDVKTKRSFPQQTVFYTRAPPYASFQISCWLRSVPRTQGHSLTHARAVAKTLWACPVSQRAPILQNPLQSRDGGLSNTAEQRPLPSTPSRGWHVAVCSSTPRPVLPEEEAPPLPTSPPAPPAQAVAAAAGFEFHQRGHAANSATCFRPKQTQEARTLPPFEPAILSRSIHGSSGKMGKTLLLLPAPPLPSPFFPGINVSPSVSV